MFFKSNSVKSNSTEICAAIFSLSTVLNVQAASTVSTTLTATSDYVADGVSQSDSKPVVQMGLDYEHDSGVYAGVWGSRIDNNVAATPNMELDYSIGFTKDASDVVDYDVGVTQYTYHHVDDKAVTDYHECYLGLTVFKNSSVYYYYADDEHVWSGIQRRLILSHTQAISDSLSLLLVAERLSYEESFGEDYSAYQIGMSKKWMDTDFTVSYWDNTIDDGADVAGDRLVFEISRSFDVLTIK